jgi:hypothetical protein
MIIIITDLVSGSKTCYRIGNYDIIELVRTGYENTNKRDLRGARN